MCDIHFELRLEKGLNEHRAKAKIYEDLLTQYAATTLDSKCSKLTLYPVSRLGLSTANVFYLSVEYSEPVEKFIKIAKFDELDKIQTECDGADRFSQKVAGPYNYKNADNELFGLLVYDAIDHGIEFYESFDDSLKTIVALKTELNTLYENLAHFHTKTLAGATNDILQDYEWYLEGRKQKPLIRMEKLGTYGNSEVIQKLIAFFQKLKKETKYVKQTLVHGDLHARNIMSDVKGTHLIDFYWAHNGHIAKDFTLLECTIIYMLLPQYMFTNRKSYLISEELNKFIAQLFNNLELSDYEKCSENNDYDKAYRRAFECIKVIRGHVKNYLDGSHSPSFKSGMHEYLHSLLLMSISIMAFKDVNQETFLATVEAMLTEVEKLNETV